MAFEALNCTNCGSADVQEVKPSTYFCNHCESVFKHIDPTRVIVGPAFCEHGNPVMLECQVCRAGMCREQCDVVPAWAADKYAGVVRTQGFGYLEPKQCYDVDVDGPYISVGKLLMSLAKVRKDEGKGGLGHVCYGCVIQAVPVAAEHISAGAICETVRCWGWSAGKCPCCQGSFCRECSTPQTLKGQGGAHDEHRGLGVLPRGDLVSIYRKGKAVPLSMPVPHGMCRPCVRENDDKVAPIAAGICQQDYAGKLVPDSGNIFSVPASSVRQKKLHEELARVEELAGRYAAEIDARLRELVPLDGNFHHENAPAGQVPPFGEYVIADERDRVRPAAVSKVVWAKPVFFWDRRERLSE